MSDQIESNNYSDHDTFLSEMERRIIQRIDDRASAHDKTTLAHVNGIYRTMDLMGKKVEAKVDGMEKSVAELKVTVEKLYSENNQILKDMLYQTRGLVATLIAIASVVIAAFTFLS